MSRLFSKLFLVFCFIALASFIKLDAQIIQWDGSNGVWYIEVDNFNDAGPGTLRDAITLVNGATSANSGILEIRILDQVASPPTTFPGMITGYIQRKANYPFNNKFILLETNLPPVSPPSTITQLIIRNVSTTGGTNEFIGIMADPILNNGILSASSSWYSPVNYGLKISTGNSTNNGLNSINNMVVLDKIGFYYFNTTVSLWSGFSSYLCANSLEIFDTKAVEIKNCTFLGYQAAIYFARVQNMNIHDNYFTSSISSPVKWTTNGGAEIPIVYLANYNGCCVNYWRIHGAIVNDNDQIRSANRLTDIVNIKDNTISGAGDDFGIVLAPMRVGPLGNYNYVSSFIDYNIKTDYTVQDNDIHEVGVGILQGFVPPKRTSKDNTYNLTIKDNDPIKGHVASLILESPYSHFIVNTNTLSTYCVPNSSNYPPITMHLGLNFTGILMPTDPSQFIFSSGIPTEYDYGLLPDNYFGFEMNNDNNVNNSNTILYDATCASTRAMITTHGNFGPINNPANQGIFINGIDFPGSIQVGAGRNVNIRKCLLQASVHPLASASFTYAPINLNPKTHAADPYPAMPYVDANGLLPKPILQEAFKTPSGAIKVLFKLLGTQFTNSNGKFEVEFFIANQQLATAPVPDELTNYVTRMDITNVNPSGNYIATIPANVASIAGLGWGDRIGVTVTSLGSNGGIHYGTSEVAFIDLAECPNCLGEFAPIPGKKYYISAWVKSENATNTSNYNGYQGPGFRTPILEIKYYAVLTPNTTITVGPTDIFKPSGPMIDYWQKIEGTFTVPSDAKNISIAATVDNVLAATSSVAYNNCYFDDIRIFPENASVKTYAYDEDTRRLMAELDDNNYATFYEYDEEGKLIRIKKETERGIMTIKESRNSKPIR